MSTKSIMASFVAEKMSPVLCSVPYGGYLYLGSSDGIIYRTVDGSYHDEFWRISDGPIVSLAIYSDALFAGTSPGGNVYMHNFSTGNRFHHMVSGDHAVTSLVVHDDILYAGTSYSGSILSFDGEEWTKGYEALRSISSMSSYAGGLYVFFSDSNSVLVFENSEWKFMADGGSVFSIGGEFPVKTSLESLAVKNYDESGVSHSIVVGEKMFFTGVDRSTVYSFDGANVSIVHQFGTGTIKSMGGSMDQLFVSIGNSVYVSVMEDESEEVDNGDDN
jgi:hypothetical protein